MPRFVAFLALTIMVTLFANGATGAPPPGITADLVADMQAKIPEESRYRAMKPAGFEHAGDAKVVAEAIARHASSPKQAAILAVFIAYESGNQLRARGDFRDGVYHSFGPLQLGTHVLPEEDAYDLDKAIVAWQALAASSAARCRALPEEEQLAAVASGNCAHGHVKSRTRVYVATKIAGEP